MHNFYNKFITSRFRKFLRNTSGNLTLAFSLAAIPTIGITGIAVDMSRAMLAKQSLREIADGAVLAAAAAKTGTKANERSEIAAQFITANKGSLKGVSIASQNIVVNDSSIKIELGAKIEGQLSKVLGVGLGVAAVEIDGKTVSKGQLHSLDVETSSLATFNPIPDACVLALSPTENRAATFAGSANVDLVNCTVVSNADTNQSIYFGGANVHLTAACLVAVGYIDGEQQATLTTCENITERFMPTLDPYANLPVPADTACRNPNANPLKPGRYCNGLTVSGTKTMDPGEYIIEGGRFRVNAGASLTGTDVLIYTKGSSEIDFNGNATINLKAKTSGPWSGVLLFGDRSYQWAKHTINGTANSKLTGALYFQNSAVDFLGNYTGENGCMQIVAKTIQMSGNTTMKNDCASYGITKIPGAQVVRIVN